METKKFTKLILKFFSEITRIIVPDYFKKYKWVKISKENYSSFNS